MLLMLALIPSCMFGLDRKPGDGVRLKAEADKYFANEQFSEALTLYTQALEAAQTDGDINTQLKSLGNIANVYAYMGDFDRAQYYFKKVYNMATESHMMETQLKVAINLTQVCCFKGDPAEARRWYKIQMSLPYRATPLYRYYALANKSLIAKTEGSFAPALFYQQQALQLVDDENLGPRYQTLVHQEMANILYRQKQYARSIKEYKKSYEIAYKNNDISGEISICQDLFVLYRHLGDSASADQYKKRYLELNDSLFGHQRMNAALNGLFDYENRQNDTIIGGLTRRNQWLTGSILVFLLFSIIVGVLYAKLRRRTRRLLESQRLLVAKNEELTRQNDNAQQLRKQYLQVVEHPVTAQAVKPDNAEASGVVPAEGSSSVDNTHDLGLSEEQVTRLLEKVNSVLEDVSVISRDDFSLAMLAKMVGSNTKYVSMVINDTYGKNFKTYLNEFRIREAQHYGNMTIQAIYEELGYKTASSFVKAFRKINGMTPSQYQKLKSQLAE